MAFDRLLYIDRLKDAGVADPVARAHAEALRDALLETVATKSDLSELATALRAEARELAHATDRKIDVLDRRIEALDRKIEITARDLTIRGAGGLVVIASLIIGLKLFG